MATIKLTVKQWGARTVTPYEQIFDTEHMFNIRAFGSDTIFDHNLNGKETPGVVVEETMDQITAALNIVDVTGGQQVKYVWGHLDATQGLATGVHILTDPHTGDELELPEGALVLGGHYDALETFTSDTDAATIKLGVATDDDDKFVAAVAISNGANAWDAGKHAIIQLETAATIPQPTTAARKVVATVAVEALTAGELYIMLKYILQPY